MQRNGFSFVELAIVLVIIGIIMGMAIKGRSLIESAKLRAELRKFDRISNAVAVQISRKGSKGRPYEIMTLTPNNYVDGTIEKEQFYEAGLLKESDFYIYTGYEWDIGSCNVYPNHYNFDLLGRLGRNVCLKTNSNDSRPASYYFICNTELILDDKDANNGDSRSYIGSRPAYLATELNNYDCSGISKDKTGFNQAFKVY